MGSRRLAFTLGFLAVSPCLADDGAVQEFLNLPPEVQESSDESDQDLEKAFAFVLARDEMSNSETKQDAASNDLVDPAYLHVQVIGELRELNFDSTLRTRREGSKEFIEREEGNILEGHTPQRTRCRVERVLVPYIQTRNNPYSMSVAFRIFGESGKTRNISSESELRIQNKNIDSSFSSRVELALDEEDYRLRVSSFEKTLDSQHLGREVWKIHALQKARQGAAAEEIYMELQIERQQALSLHLTRFEGNRPAVVETCGSVD